MSYEQLYLRNFNAMNDSRRENADKILRYLWEKHETNEIHELFTVADFLLIDRSEAKTALTYLYKRKFVESPVKPMFNGDVIELTDAGYLFMNDTNLMEEKYNQIAPPPSTIFNIGGNAVNFGNNNDGNTTNHHETVQDEKLPWYKEYSKQLILGIILIVATIFITYFFKVKYGIG
jgi:hypothetical protein